MVPSTSSRAPRGPSAALRATGRPTKADAEQLSLDLKEAALTLFLERGYEGTSLGAIARAAGTTKPSLYIRFPDKGSLFTSVVRWAIERADWPEAGTVSPTPSLDLNDLEGALRAIADAALRRATHPAMVSLARVVAAEATRFPELARMTLAASSTETRTLAGLLQRHSANGAIVADEPEILAEQFLGLVSGVPAYLASFGVVRDETTQARYTDVAITQFRRGVRPG
jgi:AcrR family transcriptional regulator